MTLKTWLLLLVLIVLVACRDGGAPEANSVEAEPEQATQAAVAEESPAELDESAGDSSSEPAPLATAAATHTPIPTTTPSPTPEPAKALTVCMTQLPRSIYLHGFGALAADAVRHAVYENLYTTRGYAYQAQGLAELPTPENGGLKIETVTVTEGDLVVNAAGELVTLAEGDELANAAGEVVVFEAEPVEMAQMVVEFTLKPLVWSDGTPVTAADSVFSFEIAADPDSPTDKFLIERTAAYEAVGDLSVRWTGVPGHRNTDYIANVWPPLPRHQLEGFTARQLLEEVVEARRMVLSTGPFVVAEWLPDEQITLVKNPHYYRAAEGLPFLDTFHIRAVPEAEPALAALAGGTCDVLTSDMFPVGFLTDPDFAAQTEGAAVYTQPGAVFEQISFGVDAYGRQARRRPDWFEDARVRQALTLCTDRQAIADQITAGHAETMDAYVPPSHPLYPENAPAWPYDPGRGNALLDEVGYLDEDEDGIRELVEEDEDGVRTRTPFSVTLVTTPGELRMQASDLFAEQVSACGVQVAVQVLPAVEVFEAGPDGLVFGRNFDLTTFGWLLDVEPDCSFYEGEEIVGPVEEGYLGWSGANVTGWSNDAFDAACEEAQRAFYGTADYTANHQAALRVFLEELPIIPLFTRVRTAVANPNVVNFKLDATQPTDLWNVYEWDLRE